MKKLRLVALLLALAMVFAIPVAADDECKTAVATIQMAGTTVNFDDSGEMLTVTVESTSLKAGSQYVILMLKDNAEVPTEGNILYIDQKAASAAETAETAGTITFDVYPSAMTDGVIYIAGVEDGLTKLVIVEGKYVLGDVNADGNINADDALPILQHSVGLYNLADDELLAANVHSDNNINADDALKILQYSVGIISSFN